MRPSPELSPVSVRAASEGSGVIEEAMDVVPGRSLSGLCAVADENQELVGMVPGGFDLKPGAAPDRGAGRDQQLPEQGDGIGLRVWGDRLDDLAGQTVVGGRARWGRPPVGDRQRVAGLLVGRRVEE